MTQRNTPTELNAAEMGFETRKPGVPIFFNGPPERLGLISYDNISGCDQAALKYRGVTVMVHGVRPGRTSGWNGHIAGFEPTTVKPPKGLRIDDTIVFSSAHVFSASATRE